MKRFLIGFAAMALVITVSASDAKAERDVAGNVEVVVRIVGGARDGIEISNI